MAITSGFFDSVSGDRVYNAEQMSHYFDGLISDGVFESVGNKFAVTTANDGMKVNVASGRAVIKCHWVQNDDTVKLALDAADATNDRIDAIALRLDRESREIALVAKKGTPASSAPQPPDITRTDDVYELYIAIVLIKAGSSRPYQISDTRGTSLCGWVTGLITQVDTATLFEQWLIAYQDQYEKFNTFIQEKTIEFNNWFSALTEQLTVETGLTRYNGEYWIAGDKQGHAAITIRQYVMDEDVLLVYNNGEFLQEDIDYTLYDGGNARFILFTDERKEKIKHDDRIYYVCLKNQIGKKVLSSGFTAADTDGIITSIFGNTTQEG